jgi:acetyl esterase
MGPLPEKNPLKARRISNSKHTAWVRDRRWKVAKVEDFEIENGLRIRVYKPERPTNGKVICYFHGGGFVIGGLDSHDNICRRLCQSARVNLYSIDYRQGPEFKFPAAHEDAIAAIDWVRKQVVDGVATTDLLVAGDSAGGNLAAFASLHYPDLIHKQILIYPVLDFIKAKPYHEIKYSFFNSENDAGWYAKHYLNDEKEKLDSRLSLLTRKDLAKSPETMIVIAEHDILKFEAIEFAKKLISLGIKVDVKKYAGMVHGFLNFPRWASKAKTTFEDIAEFILKKD